MTQQQQVQTQTPQQPRGWDQIVSLLNAAPNQQAFFQSMLDLQCKVVAAEYGALWQDGGGGEVTAVAAWPDEVAQSKADSPLIKILAEAAASGFKRGRSHVLRIDLDEDDSGQSSGPVAPDVGAHVFVTAMKDLDGKVEAVTTVVADIRDPEVIKTTLPLRELIAGMYAGFATRQNAESSKSDAERVRKTMAVLAISQEADGFHGAALNLVNELARQHGCNRVSLGWVRGRGIKLEAMSDTENLKRHSDTVAHIELAQGECLDQEHPIVYPVYDGAEPLLTQAVVHAHRRMTGEHPNRHVLSVPLREADQWIGVLTLERTDRPFDADMVKQMQLIADVVAPHLADRKATSRWLIGHACHSVARTAGYLIGPRHVGWKLVGLLALCLLTWVAIGTMTYRVVAPVVLESEGKRIVPAPYDGNLETVFHKPGDTVKAGASLAQFNVTELRLQLLDQTKQRDVTKLRYEQLIAEGVTDPTKIAQAKEAAAQIQQLEARIHLLEYQINKATITSPIDGVVITGSWDDKVGGVVKQGEAMFEIAPLSDIWVTMWVDEMDIDFVRQAQKQLAREGKPGEKLAGYLSTRSEPEISFPFLVDRIVPVATPKDASNAFEVRLRFDTKPWTAGGDFAEGDLTLHEGVLYRALTDSGPASPHGAQTPKTYAEQLEQFKQAGEEREPAWIEADWLRPGMEGVGKIVIGDKEVYWLLTHRIADTIRLWTWLPW